MCARIFSSTYCRMESGKLQILGLQACFGMAILTIILIAGPTHSRTVSKDHENKLCGDHRIYFKETQKCYPYREKGPCGELMQLVQSQEDKNIGECICINSEKSGLCPQRPTVFWGKESRCYYIYDQGPCKAGEWVVPHKDNIPSCERITCPERYNAHNQKGIYDPFIFPHKGACYLSVDKGKPLCHADKLLYFAGGDPFNHHCSDALSCGFSPSIDADCVDNSAPDFQGGCTPLTVL